MRRRILSILIVIAVLGATATYAFTRPEPGETRYTGAYAFDDGSFIFIAPREAKCCATG